MCPALKLDQCGRGVGIDLVKAKNRMVGQIDHSQDRPQGGVENRTPCEAFLTFPVASKRGRECLSQ